MLSLRKSLSKKIKSFTETKGAPGVVDAPFWMDPPPYNPDYPEDTRCQSVSITFRGSLRIVSNKMFKSFEEAVLVSSLWEKDYDGYSGKRPFYRVILLVLIRRLKMVGQVMRSGGIYEYTSEINGRTTIHHDLGNLPEFSSSEEIFTKTWDLNERRGSVKFKIQLGEVDMDPTLDQILNPSIFSSKEEFLSGCKMLGIEFKEDGDKLVLIK
ncbi:matrix protein M [American bat vesiculovirus]|uniref:Matrix protein n=1 Tax=American bat vesiculovirus TaxID=1972564 RepID=U3LZD6_9RHAB|nr:matrix protein M [American bat vesiculovirus]AGO04415.1 matrix protein M [American bat vesiculovirus]